MRRQIPRHLARRAAEVEGICEEALRIFLKKAKSVALVPSLRAAGSCFRYGNMDYIIWGNVNCGFINPC